jgi:hypothetical protein
MALFPATISAWLAGNTVSAALLIFLDFENDPMRLWTGFGDLITTDGNTWRGIGQMTQIEGLTASIGMAAQPLKFTLSGVDSTIVALAAAEADRVRDRRCVVYLQFFDPDTLQPLDAPAAVKTGVMDQLSFEAPSAIERVVSLTAEGNWTNRKRPVFSLLTDRDQNWRFPGDRGLEQVADLVNKTIRWPDFS